MPVYLWNVYGMEWQCDSSVDSSEPSGLTFQVTVDFTVTVGEERRAFIVQKSVSCSISEVVNMWCSLISISMNPLPEKKLTRLSWKSCTQVAYASRIITRKLS